MITVVLAAALIAGLCLLAYPTVSDIWNSTRQSKAVASYEAFVRETDDEKLDQARSAAIAYNERLAEEGNSWFLTDERRAEYESLLAVAGTGVMGYVDIPKISCTLPIYHGTEEDVLQVAVGHIEGSSLPIGGESTHCVVSGHRGLPSARLFTDLDKLKEGDLFTLHSLGDTLYYEIDQILTVEPNDVEALEVIAGQDYCTLVTCTPYGVNSHRLLVRGHRVDASAAEERLVADAALIDPDVIAACIFVPAALMVGGVFLARRPRAKA